MKEHHIPPQECPSCHKRFDMAGDLSKQSRVPKEGDRCICVYCATFLIFNGDLSLREADLNDMLKMKDWEREALGAIQRGLRSNRLEDDL